MTKAELDDFKPGRGLPSCVLEARPLSEDFPQLLHQVILNGIKSPHHKIILSYMPSRGKTYNDRIYYYGIIIFLFVMHIDYPSSSSVQQPQSSHTFQPRLDVCSKPPTFSKDMNNEQLAQWLRNHPSLTGTDYEQDISKLSGLYLITMLLIITIIILFYVEARINGHAFLSLNESWLERFHVSFGFQLTIMNIIEDAVCY